MFWKIVIRQLVVMIFGQKAYDDFMMYFLMLIVGGIIAGAMCYALYGMFKAIYDRVTGKDKNIEP